MTNTNAERQARFRQKRSQRILELEKGLEENHRAIFVGAAVEPTLLLMLEFFYVRDLTVEEQVWCLKKFEADISKLLKDTAKALRPELPTRPNKALG